MQFEASGMCACYDMNTVLFVISGQHSQTKLHMQLTDVAFLISVFFSSSCSVQSVMLYSINLGRYSSVIYRNLCTVCKVFN